MSLSYQKFAKETVWRPSLNKPTHPAEQEKAKVLLVEDDRTMRRMVRAEIGDHCDLILAEDASLGATLFKHERPDLSFIDINLPDSDGFSLLDWMFTFNPNAFTVMFSGHAEEKNIEKAIGLGAKGFVSKPFDVGKMMFFIRQCMEK